jgi:hypothetical protein
MNVNVLKEKVVKHEFAENRKKKEATNEKNKISVWRDKRETFSFTIGKEKNSSSRIRKQTAGFTSTYCQDIDKINSSPELIFSVKQLAGITST